MIRGEKAVLVELRVCSLKRSTVELLRPPPPWGGGLAYERVGMPVSLRGVNFGFCSHLGCSGKIAIICNPYVAVKVSFRVSRDEI